jgi:3-hydroxybutyryl-CoA dehydrogenase
MNSPRITIIGIGRMGKGIALAFSYAGFAVALIDSEQHSQTEFDVIENQARKEFASELQILRNLKIISAEQFISIGGRIKIIEHGSADLELADADFVFEAVSEVKEIKQDVYSWLNNCINNEAIVSSTTSSMSANELASFINKNERFINAHWLNPALLMPLVEIIPADATSLQTLESMKSLLEKIGKVPVVCKPSPGFILSRIQAVALNEAARIVEEGLASAEDVDKAIKTGFGIRYANLGLLEFIDWGGGDILYHATSYLASNLDEHRFSVPDIVKGNMAKNHNGIRDGVGFYEWENVDIENYRRDKMTEVIQLLRLKDLMPNLEAVNET